MNRARRVAAVLSVVMSAALLLGCGNNTDSDEESNTGDNGQVEDGTSGDTDDDDTDDEGDDADDENDDQDDD